jgi:hypothetical protein
MINQNQNISFSSPVSYKNSIQNTSLSNNSFNETINDIWLSKPADWSDDVRMNALFAPFRNRDLNPLHYDNKLKFWKQVITSYCNEKKILEFNLNQLEHFFQRKNIKPKCFELVVSEMLKEKTLSTREDILKPRQGLIKNVFNKLVWSPLAWSTSYILKPLTYTSSSANFQTNNPSSLSSPRSSSSPSLDILTSPGGSILKNDNRYFVFPDLIENRSNDLLKSLQDNVVYRNVDSLIEYDQLYSLAGNYSDTDLNLLIRYLEVNQKVLIDDKLIENKKLLKFTIKTNSNVEPVSDMELSYLRLKQTERKLELESSKLSQQIDSLNNDIKGCLKQNKNQALKYLKKRKQLEKNLENKDSVIANLQAVMMNIQQADTNQITLDVYNKSVNALKGVNKDINIDKIDETMCDLQDIMTANNEIEESLAKSPINQKYSTIDDQELNEELEDLLKDVKIDFDSDDVKKSLKNDLEEKEDAFNLDDILKSLPKIPVNSPISSNKLNNALQTK